MGKKYAGKIIRADKKPNKICFYETDKKNNRTVRIMNRAKVDEMRGQGAYSFRQISNISVSLIPWLRR